MPPPAAAVSRNLDFLDSRILGQLETFDLAGSIEEKEDFAVGIGSFSDVFKGVCVLRERKVVPTVPEEHGDPLTQEAIIPVGDGVPQGGAGMNEADREKLAKDVAVGVFPTS